MTSALGNRLIRQALAALASCLLALSMTGCGGEDGGDIPRNQANALLTLLDEAERRIEPLRCDDLRISDDDGTPTLSDMQAKVNQLPEEVDPDVRDALEEGVEQLRRLAEAECAAQEARREQQQTETAPTETLPAPTQTAPEEAPEEERRRDETKKEDKDKKNQPEPPQEPSGNGGQPAPDEEGG